MTVRGPASSTGDGDVPEEFARAVRDIREVKPRPEVSLEEIQAPRKLAPHSAAFSGAVVAGQRELATGRLVLLYDPRGQEGWEGSWRVVTYLRAELEPEIAADPLVVRVGWSWLVDALRVHHATYLAPAGTVTRSAAESFGTLAGRPDVAEMELRASWTPSATDYGAHLRGWCDVLATAAGYPPAAPGVAPLHSRAVTG